MSKPVLYTNPMSRGLIAHWAIEETGAPYETKIVSFEAGEHRSPAFLAINPMGKLPALVHGEVVVTEAAAICAYLADAFFEAGLAPALDDPARGPYLRWMFFAASCVEAAVLDKALGRTVPEGREGAVGYGTYARTLDALETALEPGPWILGERFSMADVYVGAQIGWGLREGGIEPREIFTTYAARCAARPAFQRTIGAGGGD